MRTKEDFLLCIRFEELTSKGDITDEELAFWLEHQGTCRLGIHTDEALECRQGIPPGTLKNWNGRDSLPAADPEARERYFKRLWEAIVAEDDSSQPVSSAEPSSLLGHPDAYRHWSHIRSQLTDLIKRGEHVFRFTLANQTWQTLPMARYLGTSTPTMRVATVEQSHDDLSSLLGLTFHIKKHDNAANVTLSMSPVDQAAWPDDIELEFVPVRERTIGIPSSRVREHRFQLSLRSPSREITIREVYKNELWTLRLREISGG